MTTIEKFLVLLFGAIVVGIVVTNPAGISGLLSGLAGFTSRTVGAFSGNKGFAARTGNYIPGGF
jgi:hypothetical protein